MFVFEKSLLSYPFSPVAVLSNAHHVIIYPVQVSEASLWQTVQSWKNMRCTNTANISQCEGAFAPNSPSSNGL